LGEYPMDDTAVVNEVRLMKWRRSIGSQDAVQTAIASEREQERERERRRGEW